MVGCSMKGPCMVRGIQSHSSSRDQMIVISCVMGSDM